MSWQWRMIQKLKRNQLVSSKLTWGIWQILTRALENLKNLHFNGFLLNKVYNGWAKKKYRGVLFDGTEYRCKIWRKTDLCFQKWHREFSKFSPEHVWKCKNWNFDGILLSKVQNLWAQNLQGKFVSWQWRMIQNLKRNWLVSSKLTRGIWQILMRVLDNPNNLHSNRLLLTKVCNVRAKKSIEELCLMALKLMQNLKETGLCFLKIFV